MLFRSVAECGALTRERDAAHAARDAERSKARGAVDEANADAATSRRDLARATKAGAKRCAQMLRARDAAVARDAAPRAVRPLVRGGCG